MKALHKPNLFCWSQFDEDRNIDFHSYLWLREQGNIVFDPLPLTKHDSEHLQSLGGVSVIILSNSDHVREAASLAKVTGAEIWGPLAEQDTFPIQCSTWINECSGICDGLDVYCMDGSKTKGELAFVIENETLITGDLIRAHIAGALCMLPEAKLNDVEKAKASIERVANITGIQAILPGDGWPVFRHGEKALSELVLAIKEK